MSLYLYLCRALFGLPKIEDAGRKEKSSSIKIEEVGSITFLQNNKEQTDNQALSIVHIVIIKWEQQRNLLFKHGGLKANIAYGAVPMGSRLTRRYHLHC